MICFKVQKTSDWSTMALFVFLPKLCASPHEKSLWRRSFAVLFLSVCVTVSICFLSSISLLPPRCCSFCLNCVLWFPLWSSHFSSFALSFFFLFFLFFFFSFFFCSGSKTWDRFQMRIHRALSSILNRHQKSCGTLYAFNQQNSELGKGRGVSWPNQDRFSSVLSLFIFVLMLGCCLFSPACTTNHCMLVSLSSHSILLFSFCFLFAVSLSVTRLSLPSPHRHDRFVLCFVFSCDLDPACLCFWLTVSFWRPSFFLCFCLFSVRHWLDSN